MTAYDLVLSDWNMPHVSGVELLRTIRHGKVRSHTPVLLISGDVSSRRRIEAVDAGANCFLPKPFVATELCDEVLKIISALPQAAESRPLHVPEGLSAPG
jgi:two-component system, chemotaxis family, chemotaxis protein CheY